MRTVTSYFNFSVIQISYFHHMNLLNPFFTYSACDLSFFILCVSAAQHMSGSNWRRGCGPQGPQACVPKTGETCLCLSFPSEFNPDRLHACVIPQQTSSWTNWQVGDLHGKKQGLIQGVGKVPTVQEQILGRLRACANI